MPRASKSRRPRATPTLIHLRYEFGPVSLEVDVPALRVSRTIDAMVKVHRAAVRRHPECLPEPGSATSAMQVDVPDGEDGDWARSLGPHRVGFTVDRPASRAEA